MNINIISKEKKPLLKREEAVAEVDFVGAATPSKAKLQEEFGKLMEKDAKLIVVKKIQTHFGRGGAKVVAYAYDKEDELKKIEPKEKKKSQESEISGKSETPSPTKGEEKPAKEEKPAEAPKEEKKEEAKEKPAEEEKKAEEKKAPKEEKAEEKK